MGKTISEQLKKRVKEHQTLNEKNNQLVRLSFKEINEKLGGLKKGELIAIGGRTGMGTTTLSLQLVLELSVNQKVLFNSLEHNQEWITDKVISQLLQFSFGDFHSGKYKNDNVILDLNSAINKTNERDLDIIYGFQKLADLEKELQQKAYDFVIIDWFQKLIYNENNKESDLTLVAIRLQEIAKQNNICIIVTSALSWQLEYRGGDNRPCLWDFLAPQETVNYFDKIFMLYRPEYYGFTEDENGVSNKNKSFLYLVKNTTGSLAEFELLIDDDFTKFYKL